MHDLLKNLVERLHEAAHSNLESVILYGPAAQMGSADTAPDLHVLCTLHSLDLEELARISPVVHWWTDTHKQPAPLFFTSAELQHAADVFSIELVDMQASHRVLYGADVVSNMVIPMNLHRVQVEYEFSHHATEASHSIFCCIPEISRNFATCWKNRFRQYSHCSGTR